MSSQAKTAPGMALRADQLDAEPYELCTPGGVVDLYTGLISAADPMRHRHSRSSQVAPQTMPTPHWDRFLTDMFGEGDDGHEVISFAHQLLGYSITGDVGTQVMCFLYGTGKNGKSVLLDVMIKLMGDYADAAPPGSSLPRPSTATPPTCRASRPTHHRVLRTQPEGPVRRGARQAAHRRRQAQGPPDAAGLLQLRPHPQSAIRDRQGGCLAVNDDKFAGPGTSRSAKSAACHVSCATVADARSPRRSSRSKCRRPYQDRRRLVSGHGRRGCLAAAMPQAFG